MVNPTEYLQRNRSRGTVSKLGYGITRRLRSKPFIVKFKQNKITKYVGSFKELPDAQRAAKAYLEDLRNASL